MTANLRLALVLCFAALMANTTLAQSDPAKEQAKYYHLDFAVKELDNDTACPSVK